MRPAESFIGQPIRSLQTMLRVIAENDPRHVSVIPDGIYGPETMRSVSAFQRMHGLPVTGVTDQATWEAIVAVYEPALIEQDEAEALFLILNPGQVIRKGERHPHLYLVQGMLTVLSQVYDSIGQPSMNGLLDEPTADSLASFQYLSGLPSTGNLDKTTWKHLVTQYPLAANRQIRMN
ncbi:MAG: peptidoglycan-binding protein [Oscillospiraceae bacterium]|nr:peptidoglycan-binding protein [Oscillospiraceae bacterium]